jgi:hypothetical protein
VVISFGEEAGDLNLLKPLHLDGEFIFIAVSSLPEAASVSLHLAAVSLLDQLPVRALLVPVERRGLTSSNKAKAGGAEVSLLPVIGGVSSLPLAGLLSSRKEQISM